MFIENVVWTLLVVVTYVSGADDDYNVLHKDGSFEFGYNNPDSYHFADGNRNNIVRGEFGGRDPKTGAIDSTVYTAGPRGFRPRGKNVFRKYDLSQSGPRPVGSSDDPYYDPYEDPSYNFGFKTRTYSRQESANRVGDVSGRYTYLDDIGERHNVEFIAGKRTGFHVKTPFPDSNTRAYGPLFFRGRGKPIPRGRTSIQRGLDGSYKFVSAGPDQRRTEVSDSTGHVRGSYTYLDDKGVQHSVHYIAGPETGYRVLKTVKGPHLPTVYPFDRPEILPPDFYDYTPGEGDVFDTAASGRPVKPGAKPDFANGVNVGKEDYDKFGSETDGNIGLGQTGDDEGGYGSKKPSSRPGESFGSRPGGLRPGGNSRPRPGTSFGDDDDESSIDFGDLFGESGSSTTARPSSRPTSTTFKPSTSSGLPLGEEDDGSYKPDGDDGSYKPGAGISTGYGGGSSTLRPDISSTKPPGFGVLTQPTTFRPSGRPTSARPGGAGLGFEDEYDFNVVPDKGLFGSESGRPFGSAGGSGGGGLIQVGGQKSCPKCTGTIVTNIGDRPFNVPPGVSVRAHVQSIDLYPYNSNNLSPSDQYKSETDLRREQLNEATSETVPTTKAFEDDGPSNENLKSTTPLTPVTTNKTE